MKSFKVLVVLLVMFVMAVGVNAFAEPESIPEGIEFGTAYDIDSSNFKKDTYDLFGTVKLPLKADGKYINEVGFLAGGNAEMKGTQYQRATGSGGGYLVVKPLGLPIELGGAVAFTHDEDTGFMKTGPDARVWTKVVIKRK